LANFFIFYYIYEYIPHNRADKLNRSSNCGRWPEMTSLSCRSRGSERIDSRAALDRH